jgi:hypothetical protein
MPYNIEVDTGYMPGGSFVSLEWSSKPPAQTGWYWVKGSELDPRAGVVDKQTIMCLRLVVEEYYAANGSGPHISRDFDIPAAFYDGWIPEVKNVTHWLGPLPPPEPPN